MQNEKIYVNIRPKPREIDRIHQQILYAPHIGFITAHEGRYSKLRLITKKAATKVTPAVDKYMLAWSAVKGRYINSSVSNKKVNSAAIVECKGFKVRERQI